MWWKCSSVTNSLLHPHNRLCFWYKDSKSVIHCQNDRVCFLSHRRTMTLRRGTFRSTRGLLLPSTSPKWTPLNPKSCWNCPRRAGRWWCSPQCRGSPQRRKRRRSQDCGRAASSMPIMTSRGLKLICYQQQNAVASPFTAAAGLLRLFYSPAREHFLWSRSALCSIGHFPPKVFEVKWPTEVNFHWLLMWNISILQDPGRRSGLQSKRSLSFPSCRFVVGSNRVIFMLRDGSVAWEIKDFLVSQERCVDVTVEGQVFPGKAAKKDDAKYKQQKDGNGREKSRSDPQNRAAHLKPELWSTQTALYFYTVQK